ncbi:MAG: hypothetical protein D6766_07770 [Verrucomicrobia bacterium]|nr:MAG: hypothetical protein D6766_07770 [Verrucomicrobiota bacterium]
MPHSSGDAAWGTPCGTPAGLSGTTRTTPMIRAHCSGCLSCCTATPPPGWCVRKDTRSATKPPAFAKRRSDTASVDASFANRIRGSPDAAAPPTGCSVVAPPAIRWTTPPKWCAAAITSSAGRLAGTWFANDAAGGVGPCATNIAVTKGGRSWPAPAGFAGTPSDGIRRRNDPLRPVKAGTSKACAGNVSKRLRPRPPPCPRNHEPPVPMPALIATSPTVLDPFRPDGEPGLAGLPPVGGTGGFAFPPLGPVHLMNPASQPTTSKPANSLTRDVLVELRRRVVPANSQRHGLVIGIERYRDRRLNLRCARADARRVYELMIDPECGLFPKENVELLLDEQATRQAIWKALARLRRQAGPEDTVWIFYAGHGAPEGDKVYWVSHDADVDDLYGTGLANCELDRALKDIRARQLLVLVDCCYAAATVHQLHPTRFVVRPDQILASCRGRGRVVLAATDGHERSVELSEVGHGAFTWFLTRGLRGEADRDGNGVVTADELWDYLRGRVEEASQRAGNPQSPVLLGQLTHEFGLSLNPMATQRKRRIAEALQTRMGLGSDQLSTDEVRFCLEVLVHGARSEAENGLLGALNLLADAQVPVPTLRTLVQIARQGRTAPSLVTAKEDPPPTESKDRPQESSGAPAAGKPVTPPPNQAGVAAAISIDSDRFPDVTLDAMDALRARLQDGVVTHFLGRIVAERIADWERAAHLRHPHGQWLLGICLLQGLGRDPRPRQAVLWLQKAAQANHAPAQYELGRCYEQGEGVPQDHQEAIRWYTRAAEQGDPAAQYALGVAHRAGIGVAQDHAKSAEWFRRAAEQGHKDAQFALAVCYDEGQGVPRDPAQAVHWYRRAAEQGHARAQNNLGACHAQGQGVPADPVEAFRWYRRAAEQGDTAAQFNLGLCYRNGDGVERDRAQAVKWFRYAAEQGDKDAEYHLALAYFNGEGVRTIPSLGMEWLQRAARHGHTGAQFELARRYQHGRGVEPDPAEAARWFRRAAEQGHADAQFTLGLCYRHGKGIPKDLAEAVRWFQQAAEQGHVEAQYHLAVCHHRGEGVKRSRSQAAQWYRRAAKAGHLQARKALRFRWWW